MVEGVPETHLKRIDQLAAACKAIERESKKLQSELAGLGVKFPSGLTVSLDMINLSADCLYLILNPIHLKADAGNQG